MTSQSNVGSERNNIAKLQFQQTYPKMTAAKRANQLGVQTILGGFHRGWTVRKKIGLNQ
jgi:hypothetical protein